MPISFTSDGICTTTRTGSFSLLLQKIHILLSPRAVRLLLPKMYSKYKTHYDYWSTRFDQGVPIPTSLLVEIQTDGRNTFGLHKHEPDVILEASLPLSTNKYFFFPQETTKYILKQIRSVHSLTLSTITLFCK